jgi:polar amino acid transport system substrate-binding protein
MKKKLSIMILVIIVAAFTGCGKSETSDNILKVGIDLKYPPFMYLDENGEPAGLEVDLAYAFGEYLGKDVEIVNTDFSMLVASLDSGETDIVISDMSVTEERKQKLDFTEGYRYGRTIALVNKNFYNENKITDDIPVDEFFNLEGIKFVGLSGTIATIVPQKYGVEVTEVTEIASAIAEVTNGNHDAIIGANTVIGDHAANPDTTELYFGIPEYATSAFAVKKGNTELLKKANEFIDTLYEEGGLYDQLESKYDEAIGEFLKDEKLGLQYIVTKPE